MRRLSRIDFIVTFVAVFLLLFGITAFGVTAYNSTNTVIPPSTNTVFPSAGGYNYHTPTDASGSWIVRTGHTTELVEDVVDRENLLKQVRVENKEGSQAVYVRVKALYPSDYVIEYAGIGDDEGSSWVSEADGWQYFKEPVEAGQSTDRLEIRIVQAENDRVTVGDGGRDMNVIVVYEAIPVFYDEDENPYADWTQRSDVPLWQAES